MLNEADPALGSRPALRAPLRSAPVPGSLDDLKRVHLEALGASLADGRPDHATRQRAAEALHKLGAGENGPPDSVTMWVGEVGVDWPVNKCPSCGAMLTSLLPHEDPSSEQDPEVVWRDLRRERVGPHGQRR